MQSCREYSDKDGSRLISETKKKYSHLLSHKTLPSASGRKRERKVRFGGEGSMVGRGRLRVLRKFR